MKKRFIIHFFTLVTLFFSINYVEENFTIFSPISEVLEDIRFSDLHFKINDNRDGDNDIFIVDIGMSSSDKTRKDLIDFITKIDKSYKPKVIGVDIFFENKDSCNQELLNVLSKDNVVRIHKIKKIDNIKYADFMGLSNIDTNTRRNDGYTSALSDVQKNQTVRFYAPNIKIGSKLYTHFSLLVARQFMDFKFDENSLQPKIINYNVDFTENIIDISDTSSFYKLKNKIVLVGICSKSSSGELIYNEDTHFTPRNKVFLGKANKDSYGIEILATIISNFLNKETISYNKSLSVFMNYFLYILIYFLTLYFHCMRYKNYRYFTILAQTILIVVLVYIPFISIRNFNFYLDFSILIGLLTFVTILMRIIDSFTSKVVKG